MKKYDVELGTQSYCSVPPVRRSYEVVPMSSYEHLSVRLSTRSETETIAPLPSQFDIFVCITDLPNNALFGIDHALELNSEIEFVKTALSFININHHLNLDSDDIQACPDVSIRISNQMCVESFTEGSLDIAMEMKNGIVMQSDLGISNVKYRMLDNMDGVISDYDAMTMDELDYISD